MMPLASQLPTPKHKSIMEATPSIPNHRHRHHHHHIVAIPYPGRGHINPMLSFCRRLLSTATTNLLITVVVTEEWHHLLLLSSSSPAPPNLSFRTIPNVLPSENSRGDHMAEFIHALLTKMEGPVSDLLARLDTQPPDAIVADSFLRWAPRIGERMGVPVSSFFTQSATVFLALHHLTSQSPAVVTGEENKCLNYLPVKPVEAVEAAVASKGQNTSLDSIRNFFLHVCWYTTAQSLIFTSAYELEREAVDALRSRLRLPIHTIGPSINHTTLDAPTAGTYSKWLDSQPPRSVLYVSLGSYISISREQINEIYVGLRRSGTRFLWVAREEAERIEELGMVVPWSDQLRVLSHPSVGGFLTHCGWNSAMEGVFTGIPMLTHPLKWDQFPNSKLVVDEWKIGLRLRDEEMDEGYVVAGEDIGKAIGKLMDLDDTERRKMRERAKELREMCVHALEDHSSSSVAIRAFIKDIVQREKKIDQLTPIYA